MSLHIFNRLPEVLLNEIFSIYWMDIYSNQVINELNRFIYLSKKSNEITYLIHTNNLEKLNYNVLNRINSEIMYLICNKAKAVIVHNLNPYMKYVSNSFHERSTNLFRYIDKKHCLICIYAVNVSGIYSDEAFSFFSNL
mgnify:CR=1 FL=1